MIESESNVYLNCPLYEDMQLKMYSQAFALLKSCFFYYLSDEEKIIYLFS